MVLEESKIKKVSKNELEKIKNHCIIGEKTIKKLPIFKDYENMILYYHEKNDGSGYPYGFKKE